MILRITLLICVAAVSLTNYASAAYERPTNFGIGADAEVRDWQPTVNFGFAPEMAVRIIDDPPGDPTVGTHRNDLMYMKFDLSGVALSDVPGAQFRISYAKDNQLTQGRIGYTDANGMFVYTGLSVYGVNVGEPGSDWDEGTITYDTAPGLSNDGIPGNKDFDRTKSTFLGDIDFPEIVPQNWFPAGGTFELGGSALESWLTSAVQAGAQSVTILAGLQHGGDPAVYGTAITNRTYLFVHKGILTINDPLYDADTNDPNNPLGSPWHNASNANGEFSPRLFLGAVPEPGSILLVGSAALGLLAMFRQRNMTQR